MSANGFPSSLLAKAAEDLVEEFIDGLCGKASCQICRDRFNGLGKADVARARTLGKQRGPATTQDAAHRTQAGLALLDSLPPTKKKEGTKKMGKKKASAQLAALAKALGNPSVDRALAADLYGSLATMGPEAAMAPFEQAAKAADDQLAKAARSGDSSAVRSARAASARAHKTLAGLKMVAAEHARLRDPNMIARRLSGQGVPIVKVRDELGDDRDLGAL